MREWGADVGEWGTAGVEEWGVVDSGGLAGGVGDGGLAGADGKPGAEVDELGEDELLAPRLPWSRHSRRRSLRVEVEPSSTALSQAQPHPSSNTMSREMWTHYVVGSRMQ